MLDETGVGSWRVHAACRGLDPELFFPTRGEPTGEALAACSSCPVVDPCLETALADRERIGVWGGTTERQRRQIRRARGIGRRRPAA